MPVGTKATPYLNIYINLRSRIERGQYCRSKSLFKVTCHFKRTPITPRSTLALRWAEYCHAELAIYKSFILEGKTPGSTCLTQQQVCGSVTILFSTNHSGCKINLHQSLTIFRSTIFLHYNNNNNNNTLIYIAPACRMTSEAQVTLKHSKFNYSVNIY